MKIGSEEPHPTPNPESHSLKATRWSDRFQRKMKTYLKTEVGLSFFIAFLSVVAVTFILSARYILESNLISDNTATRDIYAGKTMQVEDKDETQRLRYEARQMIAPVYREHMGIAPLIQDRLVDLLENVRDIRENSKLNPAEKIQAIRKELNLPDNQFNDALATIQSTPDWSRINDAAIKTSQAVVERGMNSEEFRVKKDQLIAQSMPDAGLSRPEQDAVALIVGARIRPTRFIDEKSTEEIRDIAASHVKPAMENFNKGDLIVRKNAHLNSLQIAALQRQGSMGSKNRYLSLIGVAILSVSLLSIVWGYLFRFEHSNYFKPAYASLLTTAILFATGGLALLTDLQPNFPMEVFPIALFSLLICIFTHPRIAILSTMVLLLLCGLTLKIPLESLSVMVIASLIGIFVLARKPIPKDRSDLIVAGLAVGIASGIVIWAISLIYEPMSLAEQTSPYIRAGWGVLSGLLVGSILPGFVKMVESIFKLITPYTLLELGNHDRPMLRRLQLEAPGTFHHSVMVATLSEAAAEAIGANPILTRVGALYHDIGKVKRPLFFVENQAYFGVENPHDKLTPRLSKMVITAHPRDGIEMGKHLGLPKVIMRFMPEHHGTLMAGYFYNKAVLEEGEENVNKSQFRYPGPKPQSKETAIVMMADACESAVRALKNPTVGQVEERVDKIIKQRIDDHQFTECSITFQDIQTVRDTFIRILRGIQHNRIEYQQNVLQELGKKPGTESLAQVSISQASLSQASGGPTLKAIQESLPLSLSASGNGGGNGNPSRYGSTTAEPLIELDSLAELQALERQQQEQSEPGPDCC